MSREKRRADWVPNSSFLVRCLCLFVALLGSVSLAAPSAELLVKEGRRSYLNGQFVPALKRFDAALKLTADTHPRAELHLLRAQCFAAMHDFRGVDTAFEQALQADPEAQLDRARILPELVDRLDALRSRLHGRLELQVEPAGTRVRLDGQLLPGTQFAGDLPIGRHTVVLEDPARAGTDVTRGVVVRPGAVQTLQLTFTPAPPRPPPTVIAPPPPQPTSPPLTPAPAPPPPRSGMSLTLGARANVGFLPSTSAGIEGSVGLEGRYWLVELGVFGGRVVGISARVGVHVRNALGPVGFYAQAEGLTLLGPVDAGIGGSAGVLVQVAPFLDLFAEGRYVRLLGGADFQRNNPFLGLGARVRLPVFL